MLDLIDERRDHLGQLSPMECELIFRSSLTAGIGVAWWLDHARAAGVEVDAIALDRLESGDFRTRAAAISALEQAGVRYTEAIANKLADDYPQVRMAAIRALERLQPDGGWRARLVYECYVPAGPFIMGDDKGDADDKPAHDVDVDAFYIGRYPVTNADYARYMADRGRAFKIPDGTADDPVVNVSWYDARDYAVWATIRLPTEAEWEKAASWDPSERAGLLRRISGSKWRYPWGDEFDDCGVTRQNLVSVPQQPWGLFTSG